MKRVIPFLPSNIVAPSFSVTLDGEICNVRVTWNISALRYYINVYGEDNRWIITVPLISSPPPREVESTIYDPFLNAVVVKFTEVSSPYTAFGPSVKPGTIVKYTLEGYQPETYNGLVRALHINETTFIFPIATDPGPVVILGKVARSLNMVESVFKRTMLIYHFGAFEADEVRR